MTATQWRYLPILKWKQGERIALQRLTAGQWNNVTVLVEPQSISAAPEGGALRAALPVYLTKMADQMSKAFPEGKPIAIDVRYVSPGYQKQARLLNAVCSWLQKQAKRKIIPVLTESMVAFNPADLAVVKDFDEHILRIHTPGVDASQIDDLVAAVRSAGIRKNTLHLVVDQYAIVNEDPTARLAIMRAYLDTAMAAGCRSTTIAGGSFPLNLIGFKQGLHDIQRVEWRIWQQLRKNSKYSELRYSDYTVSNPAPAPELDPTTMNPSVAIRYAADGYWRLFKAGGFKKGKPNQYRSLCQLLLGDPVYSGAGFSDGDDCYDKAANAKLGNGNPSSWRRDATSHHLVLTGSAL